MGKQPTIYIQEDKYLSDYYEFHVTLQGVVPNDSYPLIKCLYHNDDQDNRGKYGWAHSKALKKAFWLCTQLCIPTTRIRIKYRRNKNYRRLNKQEIKIGQKRRMK